jgi:hypothetical protein
MNALNELQLKAHNKVLELVKEGGSKYYGIYGGPGVGKSYLIDAITKSLLELKKTVAVTATTGKAASIVGGQTIASYLKLSMQLNYGAESEEDAMVLRSTNAEVIYDNVLIVDEASMLDTITSKAIKASAANFDLIIFVGDPYQLSPVNSPRPELLAIPYMHLTENMRWKSKNITKLVTDVKALIDDDLSSIDIMDYIDGKDIIHTEKLDVNALDDTDSILAYLNKKCDLYASPVVDDDGLYNPASPITARYNEDNQWKTVQLYPNGYDVKVSITRYAPYRLRLTGSGKMYGYNHDNKYLLVPNIAYDFPELEDDIRYLTTEKGEIFVGVTCSKQRYDELLQKEFNNAREVTDALLAKNDKALRKSLIDAGKKVNKRTMAMLLAQMKDYDFVSAWRAYSSLKALVHLRPAKVRSVYKSQGSTVKDVYIDLDDLQNIRGGNRNKLEAVYVALSRAKEKIYIKGTNTVLWGTSS